MFSFIQKFLELFVLCAVITNKQQNKLIVNLLPPSSQETDVYIIIRPERKVIEQKSPARKVSTNFRPMLDCVVAHLFI